MKQLSKFFPAILVLLLSYWAIKPLLAPGFYPIHDDTQVVRVYEMKTALADGLFPVRWVPDLGYGYGYPIFNFYAPFAYYVGGFLNLVGFDSLMATKGMIVLGTLLAGIAMYLFAKEFWGKIGGSISAMLYVYAPYHAVNIYVRGAVAELWAYAIVPFAFLGIYKVFTILEKDTKNKTRKSFLQISQQAWIWVGISAISYAAIIISHNLTALMITPFLFLFAIILFAITLKKKMKNGYYILISLFIGIIISAFYWLPATLEMQYTNVLSVVGGGSDYKDHFVCVSQLWNSPWGYAGSAPGCMDGLSFKLGKLHILLGALSLITLFFLRTQKRLRWSILLALAGFALSVFLVLEYSKFIWDALPQMAFFQFPWRFLILVMFFLSFLGGAILKVMPKIPQVCLGIIFIIAIIFMNRTIFTPSKVLSVTSANYINHSSLTWTTSKISDEYMPKHFKIPKKQSNVPTEIILLNDPNAKATINHRQTQQVLVTIDAPKATTALLNIAYFPSWKVYIDNKETAFTKINTGLLVQIPSGKHILMAKLTQTPIEVLANGVSLTGVIALLAGIIYLRKRDYESKKA
jgi:hypothetical protein